MKGKAIKINFPNKNQIKFLFNSFLREDSEPKMMYRVERFYYSTKFSISIIIISIIVVLWWIGSDAEPRELLRKISAASTNSYILSEGILNLIIGELVFMFCRLETFLYLHGFFLRSRPLKQSEQWSDWFMSDGVLTGAELDSASFSPPWLGEIGKLNDFSTVSIDFSSAKSIRSRNVHSMDGGFPFRFIVWKEYFVCSWQKYLLIFSNSLTCLRLTFQG